MLYNFFDAIIVGRYLGIAALGAIGATSSIIYLVLSFIVAATQGFCVILAQKFGARDLRMVRKSFAASIILSSLTAIILTLVFVPAAHPILVFLHTPEPIIDLASSYLFVTFMGISASVFYNFSANTIRALGDSVTPLFFLIFSAILNILFDLLFILKFNWSVVGAASATVLSQGICAVICLCFMFFRYKVLRIRLSDFKVSFDFLMEHLRIGYPMGFQISILTLGKIILQ
ncbi:polysaccharide biosynthesis C-terminal domain-containing protein, partial [bacterium]|nr:polysaccharide biosynthesis C-terminal domain-containing protein [bacterium]